jgi:hypothetical protein
MGRKGRKRTDAWFASYRSALRARDLRLLFAGLITSATGNWAYNVALLGFVYERTHSLAWVGAAGLARYLPSLLFSTYGGVIAERTERIRLMMSSDLLCAVWQAGLVVVAVDRGSPALALALAVLTSTTNIVYNPAVAATIPAIVNEDDLVAANALNGTIEQLVVISGPAVGAALLVFGSTSLVFAVNASSFVLSALIVSRIHVRSRPVDVTEEGRAGPLRQMAVGAKTIVRLPAARILVAFCALVSFVYGTDTVLFVGVSQHRLGTGAEGFAYLLGGLGIGGILMAAAVDRISRSPKLAPWIIGGVAGYTLPTALLTVIHSVGIAVPLEIVRGGSTLVVDVLAITALQRSVPGEQLARVFGVFFAFVLGAISLGAVITPPLISGFGLNAGLWTMGVGPFALGLLGYPSLVAMDRASAKRATILAPKVAILEQLGIFATAAHSTLERLAGAEEELSFAPAQAILREGDPADALYVLTEGEIEVSARGEGEGADHVIRTMAAPAYFGEIGVLEGIARTATVTALTDCACERIDGETLLEALSTTPASSSLMENARSRLLTTHPSRKLAYQAPDPLP